MTKTQLVTKLAEAGDISRKQADAVLTGLTDLVIKSVKKGDRIVTTGGLYGTVVSTRGDDVLVVKIADNVRVDMARPAVASVLGSETDGTP